MRKVVLVTFMVLVAAAVFAQQRTVTGKVTAADDGSPLPGVSVLVKGTSSGTVTDSYGAFSLGVPEADAVLVFSFIGLKTSEVAVGQQSNINVQLAVDVTQLSEVVVTGVGVATDKRKLGIAVESVSARDLPAAPTASIDQALVGKIAGAQISSVSGTPGADVNIVLRGINTLNRGTSPIILIDGVQVGSTNLNSIDLNTIERVEVVQGAAAATIYGAQGANGVIQLFTKKGRAGKMNIDFSSSVSNNSYLNVGGLRKAKYHAFATDASNNAVGASGDPLVFSPETLTYSENVQYSPLNTASELTKLYDKNLKYYDHYAMFFRPANTYNNSLTISGAADKVDYMLSVSNNKQESNIVNNGGVSRSNFAANVGLTLAKGLTLRSVTQLIYTKNTIKSLDRNIIYSVNNARPFANFESVDTEGNLGLYYGDAVGVNHLNPLFYQRYTDVSDNKVDVIQNFNLNYAFPKFVVLDVKYGLNHQDQQQRTVYANQSQIANIVENDGQNYLSNFAGDTKGEINDYTFRKTFQNFLASATFNFDFKKDFGGVSLSCRPQWCRTTHVRLIINNTSRMAWACLPTHLSRQPKRWPPLCRLLTLRVRSPILFTTAATIPNHFLRTAIS